MTIYGDVWEGDLRQALLIANQNGMTWRDLAKEFDVAHTTVWRFAKQGSDIQTSNLLRIIHGLVRLGYLKVHSNGVIELAQKRLNLPI